METTVLNTEWLIASEVELIYKSKVKASQRPHITSSYSAYQVALTAWDSNKIELIEQFKVIMLSNNNITVLFKSILVLDSIFSIFF